jgi:hypothetical protein
MAELAADRRAGADRGAVPAPGPDRRQGPAAVGAPTGPAVAGVLAFRLLTFWLPILPGWLAYRALRANGTI